jgi:hypothetical protein
LRIDAIELFNVSTDAEEKTITWKPVAGIPLTAARASHVVAAYRTC